MVVQQSDIDDLDTIRATDILFRDHSVQCASELVSSGGLADCSSRPEDGTEQSEDRQDDRGEC